MREGKMKVCNWVEKMFCILISGIPASGKSTAAKMISEKLQIPYFSKDSVKERLFDSIGFSSREEKIRLNLAATSVLYYIAEQFWYVRCRLFWKTTSKTKRRAKLLHC